MKILFSFILCSQVIIGFAQVKQKKVLADPIFNFQFHYSFIEPGADLSKRFGNFHNVGFGALYKSQTNWLLGYDASFQFGSELKDINFLSNLTNSSGLILNTGGYPANFSVGMRGFNTFLKGGRLFPVSWQNPNSGLIVLVGAGMYYHKINITSPRNDIPTLTADLKRGYDRLSSGPALSQFVGYYYHSHNRFYNLFIGFDFSQAFTKSIRGFNYDTMLPDNDQRLDLTYGFRFGWMIPIYLKSKNANNEYEFK